MKSVLVGLMLWISQNSALDLGVEHDLPDLQQVDAEELVDVLFRQGTPATINGRQREMIKAQIVAIYRSDHRTIYVRDELDLDSIYGRSALVHELVHFAQNELELDQRAPCSNALEWDAYRLQGEYLRQHGLKPDFDLFTVALRSQCPTY